MVLTNSVWACVVAGEPGIHPIRLLDAVFSSSWLHVNLPRKNYDFLHNTGRNCPAIKKLTTWKHYNWVNVTDLPSDPLCAPAGYTLALARPAGKVQGSKEEIWIRIIRCYQKNPLTIHCSLKFLCQMQQSSFHSWAIHHKIFLLTFQTSLGWNRRPRPACSEKRRNNDKLLHLELFALFTCRLYSSSMSMVTQLNSKMLPAWGVV